MNIASMGSLIAFANDADCNCTMDREWDEMEGTFGKLLGHYLSQNPNSTL